MPKESAIALGPLRFHVEHRSFGDDGGPTLRVSEAGGSERLRFDCFREAPHYHVDPDGRDEVVPIDRRADPIEWTFDALRDDLPGLLDKSGWRAEPAWSEDAQRVALRDAERAMRNPPRDIQDLEIEKLEQRVSEKWNTYPKHLLAAWVAEMDFPVAAPVRARIQRFVDNEDYGYALAPHETGVAEAFCERMDECFGWKVAPREVEMLTDVVQGMYLALLAYSERGQGVIVQTPIYPPFLKSVKDTGRRLVENRLVQGARGFEIDFDRLRADVDDDTRLLLLCNPHNPTGRAFTRAELEGLAQLALERDLVVVSDEIHGELVFEGHEHVPFATLSPEIAERTLTLTSATKSFNIPGLRCCIAHFGGRELKRRLDQNLPRNVRGGMGLLGMYATVSAWRHGQPWLDQVKAVLARNRDIVAETLAERCPEIVAFPSDATYFAWLDCRALELEPSAGRFFYEKAGVVLSDGPNFGSGLEGYARLNFATSEAILRELLGRMLSALGR